MKKQPRYLFIILYALVLLALFAAVSRLAKTPEVQTLPYSSVVGLAVKTRLNSSRMLPRCSANVLIGPSPW